MATSESLATYIHHINTLTLNTHSGSQSLWLDVDIQVFQAPETWTAGPLETLNAPMSTVFAVMDNKLIVAL